MSDFRIENDMLHMDCGCSFKILANEKEQHNSIPPIEIDYYNINYACPKTWELFCSGNTAGLFQLEQSLGSNWSEKLQPKSLPEVAALASVIRPGTLKAVMEDGKTAAVHFAARKKHEEDIESIDSSIDNILEDTYGLIIYQETAMQIATKVAGFDLKQADSLRKAMGKKDAELMSKVRTEFIEGCKKVNIISSNKAVFLFDIIEKSNRYSFNKSHAYAYGEIAIWTAFAKSHFPQEFFCSYLRHSKDKDAVSILVNDAKRFKIDLCVPSILKIAKNFSLDKLAIRFGVGNIEKIGEKNAEALLQSIHKLENERQMPIEQWSWYEILLYLTPTVSKTIIQNMISVGGFAYLGMYRKYMLFEYLKFLELDNKDIEFLKYTNTTNLIDGLTKLLGCMNLVKSNKSQSWQIDLNALGLTTKISTKNGILKFTDKHVTKLKDILNILKNPPPDLVDTEEWIDNNEKKMLGVQITCMKIDTCDTSFRNCFCVDFKISDLKEYRIAAQINKISQYSPKQGKLAGETMAYLTLSDESGSCEAVAFPNTLKEFSFLLFEGNTIGITGKKSSSGGLQINKVVQL